MSELSEDEAENFSAHVIKFEQWVYIKIETLCGITVPVNYALLKEVCGNATLDRITVQWWHKHFRERRVSMEDHLWFGCPSTAIDNTSIATVATMLNEDGCATVREIKAESGIPKTTVHCILTKHLFKKKVVVWCVPHSLKDTQKQTRLKITREYLK